MMSAESNLEKSVSYQKKDGRVHARPSFFGYDNDKDLKVCFLVTRIKCSFKYEAFEGKKLMNYVVFWEYELLLND